MSIVDKNRPTAEWIADLRRRFPCEPEIDRVLTRKLERRAGPPYTPISLEALVEATEALIKSQVTDAFTISGARWLSGGASKIQMAFELTFGKAKPKQLVLRMEPAESINETSRLREFQLIKAFEGVIPVPSACWMDPEGRYLPYPALICSFVDGVTKPRNAKSQATGMGTYFAPEWRSKLGPQFVDCLAKIHTRDIHSAGLAAFEKPEPGISSALLGLNMWERVWEEDSGEDIPLMRFAACWLRENAPPCDPVILHSDYRVGNFLFTEHDAKITAVLDWEGGRIGDHHYDLAWASAHAYGHFAEDGKTFLVGSLMSEPEFFEGYERASGLTVNQKSLKYYQVFIAYVQGVIALATAYRVARNGKSHQDVMQAWILGIGPSLNDNLCKMLEEVA